MRTEAQIPIDSADFASAASLVPAVDIVTELEPGHWILECDGGFAISADWLGDHGKLRLSLEIGTPSADQSDRVRQTALSFNAAPVSARGTRVGAAGASGPLLLIGECSESQLRPQSLCHRLDDFLQLGMAWTRYIASPTPVPFSHMGDLIQRV